MSAVSGTQIRPARLDEFEAVAALRWRWVVEENGGAPTVDRDEFVREFAAWARRHAATHRCLVLTLEGEVTGMAFLATIPRVPSLRALGRASGDLQCVYVTPEQRDKGLGGLLIDAVLDLAGDLGFERVTVHSSERAISAYERHAFATSLRLLQASPSASSQPGRAGH